MGWKESPVVEVGELGRAHTHTSPMTVTAPDTGRLPASTAAATAVFALASHAGAFRHLGPLARGVTHTHTHTHTHTLSLLGA